MSAIDSSRRHWGLGFGVAYLLGAFLAGFNQDLVWHVFAWDGIAGQVRHLVSVLTTIYPHIVAIPGLVLLIAGVRLSRRSFIAVALLPPICTLGCLALRALY